MFFQFYSVSSQGCVPYFTTEQPDSTRATDQQSQPLWCRKFFSQCDCVAISSSRSDLSLSEAERQITVIVDQAELFGVSRLCRNSFVSLYCHQVYIVHDQSEHTDTNNRQQRQGEDTQTSAPNSWNVCLEDCERVITTDCSGDNWNILSNVIAQFIERATIQLPALKQLEDCAVSEPTIGGIGMENVSCVSLQPSKHTLCQYTALHLRLSC